MTRAEPHEMLTHFFRTGREAHQYYAVTARCGCGEWSASKSCSAPANVLTCAHRDHRQQAARHSRETLNERHRAWHAQTGHCGDCGQPDGYCTCNGSCGCTGKHPAGEPDALTRYAIPAENQRGLW